jgi:hypothetical protein
VASASSYYHRRQSPDNNQWDLVTAPSYVRVFNVYMLSHTVNHSSPFLLFATFIRFPKISVEMKLVKGSTYLDYMKPFKDTQDALFRLLSHTPIEWIPASSTSWELSKAAYADTNLVELSESIMSCPICLEISSLGLYYQCTHECCILCVRRNKQKLCGQCRKPSRPDLWRPRNVIVPCNPTMDDDRLGQFNGVIKELLYHCPCKTGNCNPTTFANAHETQCPGRFICPLDRDDEGCGFDTGVDQSNLLLAHLMDCHPMENLWRDYAVMRISDKITENVTSPWHDDREAFVLAARGC